jgi:pimeloyl-ACP methyl ester carboxylesterase
MAPPRVSFFTEGQRQPHKDSYIIINQVYVNYRAPITASSSAPARETTPNLPLLFIHGGGCTGAQWESTPDRRPGWAVRASEAGFHIYSLDGVDSGRSQRAPSPLRSGSAEWRTAGEIWARFRCGPQLEVDSSSGTGEDRRPEGKETSSAALERRVPFEEGQFPVAELDGLVAAQAVRRRTVDEIEGAGIVDVLEEIGECVVVAHSHGAALMLEVLEKVRHLIKMLVLVEPGETGVASKVREDIPTFLVWGDHLDEYEVWPRIAKPYEDVKGLEILKLPEIGIKGNSHFPMSDLNSDDVWKQILDWIQKRVPTT